MNEQQLARLLPPILAEFGLELEDVHVTPVGKRRIVRVTVDGDGPHGRGPLLDDITAASQAISQALDEATFVGSAPFTLEVSSRGVSKPLTAPKHFRRNTGRLLKVWLADTEFEGRIEAADDDAVTLDVAGAARDVAYTDIKKAVVQVELNRPAPDSDDADDIDDEEN